MPPITIKVFSDEKSQEIVLKKGLFLEKGFAFLRKKQLFVFVCGFAANKKRKKVFLVKNEKKKKCLHPDVVS